MSFGVAIGQRTKNRNLVSEYSETKFRFFGFLFSILIFFGLIFATPAYGATEFVSIIDPDNGVGTDYTSLSAWEAAIQADLSTSTTKVFSVSSSTGAMADLVSVRGENSNASGTLKHRASSSGQILLVDIVGTFLNGEKVYIDGGSTSTNFVILSNAGDSAIAVASCRSTNGTADVTAVTIDGWTTSAANFIKVWTDPTTGARHNGKWDNRKYRLETSSHYYGVIADYVGYVILDGLQLFGNDQYRFIINFSTLPSDYRYSSIKNSIIKSDNTPQVEGIHTSIYQNDYFIHNNIIVDASIGINRQDGDAYIYNNTIINTSNNTGIISTANRICSAINNIIQTNGGEDFNGTCNSSSSNNITSDGTAPGANSKSSTTVAFIDAANKDFHLSPTDTAAKDSGTSTPLWDANLSFHDDINGTGRGGAWDIGADEVSTEFISTIGETTGDYHSLSAWEEVVNDQYLTNDERRIFSGTASGTLNAYDFVTLVRGGSSLGITGYVKATTSNQIFIRAITGTSTPVVAQSGDQWVLTAENLWIISGTADQLGASPAIVAKITGAWTSAETSSVAISGWGTSYDNYIKIYTEASARHGGKWDATKYRIDVASGFGIENNENYVRIDGIQIDSRDSTSAAIENRAADTDIGTDIRISNNILWGNSGTWSSGVMAGNSTRYTEIRVWNNMIFDWLGSDAHGIIIPTERATSSITYVYNNTIYNCRVGIDVQKSIVYAINNLVQNSTSDGYEGIYATSSDYNISDRAGDAPNLTFATTSKTAVFTATMTDDFHLADTDTSAKGAGVNLYSDANINVTNDIDSAARPISTNIGLNWDIGADQTAVKIYRSIAPSVDWALASGESNALSISSSTSLATFASALVDYIGVGDVVIYNTGGTATGTAFIHGRTDSTHYTVKTASGTSPTAVTSDTSWSIYRAYTSLFNAEAGTENTGIANETIRNFDAWSGGADLVASNTQMNIAAYANDPIVDSLTNIGTGIDGWTTSAQNNIRIYTPFSANEVGTSQRHSGKWDDKKYVLSLTQLTYDYSAAIMIRESFVNIDGMQIRVINQNSGDIRGVQSQSNASYLRISNNIVWGTVSNGDASGIIIGDAANASNYVWNNIVYGFNRPSSNSHGIVAGGGSGSVYIYNNTVIDSNTCYTGDDAREAWFNNVAQNCANGYSGWSGIGNYNLSDLAGDAPGANSKNLTTVSFVDATNKDFHLAPTDTAALDAGTSTPATDSNLSFTDDIDGNYRRQWDIGADEGSVEYVTSVMEAGGNFSTLSAWEAANQVDLATTSTAVFSLSSATGTIPANASVMGLTSGAIASTTVGSVSTSTQILLYNIASSTFLAGETIYIKDGATTSNYAILSNAGNPAIATAKIDGAWTGVDATAVTFSGWTTGPTDYIRVYTTPAARHNGTWGNGYRRSGNLIIQEEYARVDGLSIKQESDGRTYFVYNFYGYGEVWISNCFGWYAVTSASAYDVYDIFSVGPVTVKLWNNIGISDSSDSSSEAFFFNDPDSIVYAYNNTGISENGRAFRRGAGTAYVSNALGITGNNTAFLNFANGSVNYSASNDGTADDFAGTGNKVDQSFSFIDSANNDYHLAPTDTVAKDNGTSTAADTNLAFITDIDGQARGSSATTTAGGLGWDIGADEGASIMYRSVGNDTSNLNSGAATVMIASSTATFSSALANNIGVGDVIQYGPPTGYSLAFITGRASSTVYTVVNATGSLPVATTSASASIYRAHTLLNNWQTQTAATVNQSIDSSLRSQVLVARDLVASNTAMFVAAYASSSPDNTAVLFNTWTTGAGNYIKIYTPVNSSEVGISQRHAGKWDSTKYRLAVSDNYRPILNWVNYIWFDGLQISNDTAVDYGTGMLHRPSGRATGTNIRISNNLIRTTVSPTYKVTGLDLSFGAVYKVWNNVLYDFSNSDNGVGVFIWNDPSNGESITYLYNNTIFNSAVGIETYANGTTTAINNIVIGSGNTNAYLGTFATGTDYNATDGTDSIGQGTHNKISQTFNFIDQANRDLHLAPTDAAARDAGVSLAGDSYLPFAVDIDGNARPYGAAWDIGADEDSSFTPDFLFKGKVKFKGKIRFND